MPAYQYKDGGAGGGWIGFRSKDNGMKNKDYSPCSSSYPMFIQTDSSSDYSDYSDYSGPAAGGASPAATTTAPATVAAGRRRQLLRWSTSKPSTSRPSSSVPSKAPTAVPTPSHSTPTASYTPARTPTSSTTPASRTPAFATASRTGTTSYGTPYYVTPGRAPTAYTPAYYAGRPAVVSSYYRVGAVYRAPYYSARISPSYFIAAAILLPHRSHGRCYPNQHDLNRCPGDVGGGSKGTAAHFNCAQLQSVASWALIKWQSELSTSDNRTACWYPAQPQFVGYPAVLSDPATTASPTQFHCNGSCRAVYGADSRDG